MTRGRLRIYLGAAPGVGKTFAMLAEGARRAARGADVLVGVVDTHGRPMTADALRGLPALPNADSGELDVAAVLARRPKVVLVDDLAHANAPTGRHKRRWEDVDDLLRAGIDVVSTLNIQHLESLSDVVESIIGRPELDTVPDAFVRRADQLELIDMAPEALRSRIAHGNVYEPEQPTDNEYFRVGNLAALRELALVWLADRVDEGLVRYRREHDIADHWATRERLVVALSGGADSEALLRRGARIASRGAGGELFAVYVPRPGLAVHVGEDLAELARLRALAADLGGDFHTVTSADPSSALLEFARAVNASQIVVGASRRTAISRLLRPGIVDRVIAGSGDMDVLVVAQVVPGAGHAARPPVALPGRRRLGFAAALVVPSLLTLVLESWPHHPGLPITVPLYLLAIVLVAMLGGLGPGLIAAVVSGLLVNWFFTPPFGTLAVADPANVAALLLFVAVAVVVSLLVQALARRAAVALAAQGEASALAELTDVLLDSPDQLAALLERAVATFGVRGAAIVRRDDPRQVISATEQFVDHGGEESDHEAAGDHHELLLQPCGLPAGRRRLFAAYGVHAATILRRRELEAEASGAAALAQDNRARTALLSAVSHDLRTPLAGIKAAIGSLRAQDITWTPDDEAELKEAIEDSADRLDALIGNLLAMSRLQAGALVAHPRRIDLGEVVPPVVKASGGRVDWAIAPDARFAVADPGLLDRVLGNLVENALKHHPSDAPGPVTLGVSRVGERIEIRVADHGVGVPEALREQIFQPFQRYGDTASGQGVGLGLAIARGLAEAMNGTVVAEPTPGRGLTMVVTLPAGPTERTPT